MFDLSTGSAYVHTRGFLGNNERGISCIVIELSGNCRFVRNLSPEREGKRMTERLLPFQFGRRRDQVTGRRASRQNIWKRSFFIAESFSM